MSDLLAALDALPDPAWCEGRVAQSINSSYHVYRCVVLLARVPENAALYQSLRACRSTAA